MSFNWHVYLSETGAEISSTDLFPHVCKSFETLLKKKDILEVNYKCIFDRAPLPYAQGSWWPAEVVFISGYLVLLRWCIPDVDTSSTLHSGRIEETVNLAKQSPLHCCSFWIDVKGVNWQFIRPLGWCRSKKLLWSPPPFILHQIKQHYDDWQSSQWSSNLNKRAVPSVFFERRCLYAYETVRIGGYFECEHELDPCCVWPAKVLMNVGGRVLLSWFGISSQTSDSGKTTHKIKGFTLHYLNRRLHPLGWGKLYGLKYCQPPGFAFERAISNIDAFIRGAYSATYSDQTCLTDCHMAKSTCAVSNHNPPLHEFKVGWKLEAVNPMKRYQMQPATIVKVFNSRYFLVELDNLHKNLYVETTDSTKQQNEQLKRICFVGFASMPEIMAVNASQLRGIHLSPPPGWDSSRSFTWTNYLTYLSSCRNKHAHKSDDDSTQAGNMEFDDSTKSENPSMTHSSTEIPEEICYRHPTLLPNNLPLHPPDMEDTTSAFSLPFCPPESVFKGIRVSNSLQRTENDYGTTNSYSSNRCYSFRKEADCPAQTDRHESNSTRFLLGMKVEMALSKDASLMDLNSSYEIGPLCAATVTRVEYPHLLWLLPDLPASDPSGHDQRKPIMVDARSTDLYPVGWAEFCGYPIISPPGYENSSRCSYLPVKNEQISKSKPGDCFIPSGSRPAHELQTYVVNYVKDAEVCPPIYINSGCYLGPYLCKTNLESLPQCFGPGSVTRVMQNLITRLIRVAYKPLRVLRMFEADWASGMVSALNNLHNAEQMRTNACNLECSNTRSQNNARISFRQAEKELTEQCRSAMSIVLIGVRCPRRGIKIVAPVEVCTRVRAVEEFCRQVSLAFEACPHLLSFTPPLRKKSEPLLPGDNRTYSPTNLTGNECTPDIKPLEFAFDTINSQASCDCPSFCGSRLRSRYLDRLPGSKRRSYTSLRSINDRNATLMFHGFPTIPDGLRTRSTIAAAQQEPTITPTKSESPSPLQPCNPVTYGLTTNNSSIRSRKKHQAVRGVGTPMNGFSLHPFQVANHISEDVTYRHLATCVNVRTKTKVESTGVTKATKRPRKPSNISLDEASFSDKVKSEYYVPQLIPSSTCKYGKHPISGEISRPAGCHQSWYNQCAPGLSADNSASSYSASNSSLASSTKNGLDINNTTTISTTIIDSHSSNNKPIHRTPLQCLPNPDALIGDIPKVILSSNPMFWTPVDLASYLGNTDCREMWPWLAAEAVDGQAFMLLTLPVLHRLVGLRWEDAVRLARHVISVKQAFVEQFGIDSQVGDSTTTSTNKAH